MVQIGDKVIDYNEEFRLFLATRNPSPEIPADAASVITEVNFTTTRAGLTSQVSLDTGISRICLLNNASSLFAIHEKLNWTMLN